MRRAAIYSSTSRSRRATEPAGGRQAQPAANSEAARQAGAGRTGPPAATERAGGLRPWLRRHERLLVAAAAVLAAVGIVEVQLALAPPPSPLTQDDIDAAVVHTLENRSLPSRAAKAAENVRESVVRVRGYVDDGGGELMEMATGSGVVIVDKGIILTNLHVVQGAEKVTITFFDGLEAEAVVTASQPDNDLAVVQAKAIPDDLPAATLGTTHKLRPGDEVVAVGFPFSIGPSVSSGVVSGLNREFQSPDGQKVLSRLIQFDAAANPGSSGGPLVTMDGEVVGIVTAIYSPNEARTFVGIGFAVTIEAAGNAAGLPPF